MKQNNDNKNDTIQIIGDTVSNKNTMYVHV